MGKPLNILIYSQESSIKDLLAEKLTSLLTSHRGIQPDISRSQSWPATIQKVMSRSIDVIIFEEPKGQTHSIGDATDSIKLNRREVFAIALVPPDNKISANDIYTKLGLDGTITIDPDNVDSESVEDQLFRELIKREEWESLAEDILLNIDGLKNLVYLGKCVTPSIEERCLTDGRRISNISEVSIYFAGENNKENSIKVIRKFMRDDPNSDENEAYERFYNLTPELNKCIVPYHGAIQSEKAILLGNWNRAGGKLGDNTLEQRLKEYYLKIREAHLREDQETVERLKRERRETLLEVTRLLAYFHYHATRKVNIERPKGTEGLLEEGICPLKDSRGNAWNLKCWQKKDYYEKFLCDTQRVITYLNEKNSADKKLSKKEIGEIMQELKGLLAQNESFFDWATIGPFTVIHHDMYGENILHNKDCSIGPSESPDKFKDRLADLRHIAFGPTILDFGFLESPYIGFEKLTMPDEIDLEQLYIREELKMDCFGAWITEIDRLFSTDGVKPASIMDLMKKYDKRDMALRARNNVLYWHMKIAADIAKAERDDALHMQIGFSKRSLAHLLRSHSYDQTQRQFLEKLNTFFEQNIYSKMGLLNGRLTGDS
ncbi:hypothetical protein KY325_03660 [Candidatus Woesearchaeota archaeon]|nr:hypothetical protein [Candidatus Woesearchaeota archaeon]MBW3018229.1 hypothetical protein [Candidatus Woesearchaeota archaeon]